MAVNERGLRKETSFATVRVRPLYAHFFHCSSFIPICVMRDPYFDKQEVQHLFDSAGVWIAFRIERHVFDTVGNWVGWLPFENDDTEVHSTNGLYLGHICEGNRFYRNSRYLFREAIEKAAPPSYFPMPTPPARQPPVRLPIGCNDIRLSASV
jgi:hypothetical protein